MGSTQETVSLANGARLAVDYAPDLETIAVGVFFNAGARDETQAENGLAHLLEHMAFKGTAQRSAKDIAETIENVGGWLNASTGYQRTAYYARALKSDLDIAFDLLADILFHSTFKADEMEKERRVVAQEIAEAFDNPEDHVYTLLQQACFPDQAIGRAILGAPETLAGINADALRGFMRDRYQPEGLVVSVAGGLDPETIFKTAERCFGGLQSDQRAEKRPRTPARYEPSILFDTRDVEQTHIALALRGAAVNDADFYAARVFSEILGGGMASRLFQTIREKRGLAYSVYSFAESYDDVGLIDLYAATDAENAPEAIAAMRTIVADMASGVADEEIARAKAVLKANLLMGQEAPLGRAEAMAGQLYAEERLTTTTEICARVDAVSAQDVKAFAQRAIAEPAAMSIVGPVDADKAREALDNT